MSRTFISHFAPYILELVQEKHALGLPYEKSEIYLRLFDRHCAEFFPEEKTITQDLGMSWATIRPYESKEGFTRRITPIRQLAKYMIREGNPAFVIPSNCGRATGKRPVPHIFTDYELKRIFEAADHLSYRICYPTYHLVAPVLFRLMYSCGLRPAEGRLLKRQNIDLANGVIKILESKGHKERIVVMHEEMTELCRLYHYRNF